MEGILPNFLILGAQKSGTTWLHEQLSHHPQIYMSSVKEIHYFDINSVYKKGPEFYSSHFIEGTGKKVIGESTPNYLSVADNNLEWVGRGIDKKCVFKIPERINKSLSSDVKFVIILRDPVKRAISAFYHHLKYEGRIKMEEPFRENVKKYGIVFFGFYAAHLKKYFEIFDPNKFKIIIYERLFEQPDKYLQNILSFLEIEDNFDFQGLNAKIHASKAKFEVGGEYFYKDKVLGSNIKIISREDVHFLKYIFKTPNNNLRYLLNDPLQEWCC